MNVFQGILIAAEVVVFAMLVVTIIQQRRIIKSMRIYREELMAYRDGTIGVGISKAMRGKL